MRCARCHRQLQTATVTLAGVTFGPRCALLMGLMPAVQPAAKTRHRTAKREISKNILKKIFEQDGQVELFERME